MERTKALFGPAGNCDDFHAAGYKHTVQMFPWIAQHGLTAYEYQCGRGVRLSASSAASIRAEAEKYGVAISLHAPYFISLASAEEEKRDNSIRYILDSARAVTMLGGDRIVVHPGGLGGRSREEATAFVYTAAAFHDTGLSIDRKTHHLESGRIIREAQTLRQWFSEQEIELIAQAAEDHRASSKTAPRSDYGRILAEADRVIDPITIIRRTIQFGLSNYPEHSKEEHWERTVEHLLEKYAEGGYLKLWVPQSPNAARLEELRSIIRDRAELGTIFEKLFDEEIQ